MSRSRPRFNLLLLSEGEYLLDECVAVLHYFPPTSQALERKNHLKGRLRIATQGLFFEPDDIRLPINKFSFRAMEGKPSTITSIQHPELQTSIASALGTSAVDSLIFQSSVVIDMKPGSMIGPYVERKLKAVAVEDTEVASSLGSESKTSGSLRVGGFLDNIRSKVFSEQAESGPTTTPPPSKSRIQPGRATFALTLLHTPVTQVLPTIEQLWDVQQGCKHSYAGSDRGQIDALINSRLHGPFDLSQLRDVREECRLPAQPAAISVERVFPMVSCPGRLMITNKGLYLQAVAVNTLGQPGTQWWGLRSISRVLRRSYLQRQVGLEIVLKDGVYGGAHDSLPALLQTGISASMASSLTLFLTFDNPSVRDNVYVQLVTSILEDQAERSTRPHLEDPQAGLARIIHAARSSLVEEVAGTPIAKTLQQLIYPSDSIPTPAELLGSIINGKLGNDANFKSAAIPEFLRGLRSLPVVDCGDIDPLTTAVVFRAWQRGSVDNYEYLSFLNTLAGRTTTDLTQYPVFPWVLCDYTSESLDFNDPSIYRDLSKPLGALNEARLRAFRARYEDMPREEGMDAPFLYGTHYSTPGYVCYYLVRTMPEHMLRLQAGRFDAPDRLFYDIANTWQGVVGMNSDMKELIPEFYDSHGEFLVLVDDVHLGVRQNGSRVADVSLPPWTSSPGTFINMLRRALESDYVSQHLHQWIDLIFGYKQRGEAADAADNVFHPVTYEGTVDVEREENIDTRRALQSQIAEFGQTPKQLFLSPHPGRQDIPDAFEDFFAHWLAALSNNGGGATPNNALRNFTVRAPALGSATAPSPVFTPGTGSLTPGHFTPGHFTPGTGVLHTAGTGASDPLSSANPLVPIMPHPLTRARCTPITGAGLLPLPVTPDAKHTHAGAVTGVAVVGPIAGTAGATATSASSANQLSVFSAGSDGFVLYSSATSVPRVAKLPPVVTKSESEVAASAEGSSTENPSEDSSAQDSTSAEETKETNADGVEQQDEGETARLTISTNATKDDITTTAVPTVLPLSGYAPSLPSKDPFNIATYLHSALYGNSRPFPVTSSASITVQDREGGVYFLYVAGAEDGTVTFFTVQHHYNPSNSNASTADFPVLHTSLVPLTQIDTGSGPILSLSLLPLSVPQDATATRLSGSPYVLVCGSLDMGLTFWPFLAYIDKQRRGGNATAPISTPGTAAAAASGLISPSSSPLATPPDARYLRIGVQSPILGGSTVTGTGTAGNGTAGNGTAGAGGSSAAGNNGYTVSIPELTGIPVTALTACPAGPVSYGPAPQAPQMYAALLAQISDVSERARAAEQLEEWVRALPALAPASAKYLIAAGDACHGVHTVLLSCKTTRDQAIAPPLFPEIYAASTNTATNTPSAALYTSLPVLKIEPHLSHVANAPASASQSQSQKDSSKAEGASSAQKLEAVNAILEKQLRGITGMCFLPTSYAVITASPPSLPTTLFASPEEIAAAIATRDGKLPGPPKQQQLRTPKAASITGHYLHSFFEAEPLPLVTSNVDGTLCLWYISLGKSGSASVLTPLLCVHTGSPLRSIAAPATTLAHPVLPAEYRGVLATGGNDGKARFWLLDHPELHETLSRTIQYAKNNARDNGGGAANFGVTLRKTQPAKDATDKDPSSSNEPRELRFTECGALGLDYYTPKVLTLSVTKTLLYAVSSDPDDDTIKSNVPDASRTTFLPPRAGDIIEAEDEVRPSASEVAKEDSATAFAGADSVLLERMQQWEDVFGSRHGPLNSLQVIFTLHDDNARLSDTATSSSAGARAIDVPAAAGKHPTLLVAGGMLSGAVFLWRVEPRDEE